MRAAITSERAPRSGELSWIALHPPLAPGKRLDIYRTAWWLRLYESIEEDYEALARCLGTRAFRRLVQSYLRKCPSQSYTLVHASNRLPEFIARWRDPSVKPWMADLARLERAQYQAFHATPPNAWDPENLATLTPTQASRLKIRLQPSATLLKSRWRITELLNAGRVCDPGICRLVVYREGFKIQWLELNALQFSLLKISGEKGATLGAWAKRAGSAPWVQWLGDWARAGIIAPG